MIFCPFKIRAAMPNVLSSWPRHYRKTPVDGCSLQLLDRFYQMALWWGHDLRLQIPNIELKNLCILRIRIAALGFEWLIVRART